MCRRGGDVRAIEVVEGGMLRSVSRSTPTPKAAASANRRHAETAGEASPANGLRMTCSRDQTRAAGPRLAVVRSIRLFGDDVEVLAKCGGEVR